MLPQPPQTSRLIPIASGTVPEMLPSLAHSHIHTYTYSSPSAAFECQFTDLRPPYSFSCLIALAIDRSPQQRASVSYIYQWIDTNFPYFNKFETARWKVGDIVFMMTVSPFNRQHTTEFGATQSVAEQVLHQGFARE